MREIKYKAVNRHRKEVVIINDLYWFEENGVHNQGGGLYGEWDLYDFIGRNDKNDVEMYAGDIVKYRFGPGSADFTGVIEYHADKILEIGYEQDEVLFVGFILKGWCPITEEFWYRSIPHVIDIEIIGSDYKNPRLLKEGIA